MQSEPREHDRNVRQAAVSRVVSGFFQALLFDSSFFRPTFPSPAQSHPSSLMRWLQYDSQYKIQYNTVHRRAFDGHSTA